MCRFTAVIDCEDSEKPAFFQIFPQQKRWRRTIYAFTENSAALERGLFSFTENSATLERVSFPSRRTPRRWRGSLFLHGELRGAGEGLFFLTENSAALAQPCTAFTAFAACKASKEKGRLAAKT